MRKKIFFLITILFLLTSVGKTNAQTATGAHYILNVNKLAVQPGDTLIVTIFVDTKAQPVNAVEAILTYPSDKLQFFSMDTGKSAFSIAAQSTTLSEKIIIARGNIFPVTSAQAPVAQVLFKVKKGLVTNELSISSASAIVRSTDNKNIMTGSTFGQANDTSSPATSDQQLFSKPALPKDTATVFNGIDFFTALFSHTTKWIHNIFSVIKTLYFSVIPSL